EQIGQSRYVLLPGGQLAARLLEDPRAERHDHPGLFGDADEALRRNGAALGMRPAAKRLDAGNLARAQIEDRLVDEIELPLLDGAAQRALEPELRRHLGVLRAFEQCVLRLALLLGAV